MSLTRTPKVKGVDPLVYRSMARKQLNGISLEAFDLMYEHKTPPDPMSYSVWFAYVAQISKPLVRVINQRLKQSTKISNREVSEMYRTYIEDGYHEATCQNLGLELECNLKNISELIDGAVRKSSKFGDTLENTAIKLDGATSAKDLKSILSDMTSENQDMLRSTRAMNAELSASQQHIAQLNRSLEELQVLSMRDPLTDVANRRAFDARLLQDIKNAEDDRTDLCVALIDLDHFKRINDQLGHQAGDKVLIEFAKFLNSDMPDDALVARYGGEEFSVVLSQTRISNAHESLMITANGFPLIRFLTDAQHAAIGDITASVGIAAHQPGQSATELLAAADRQLYAAKEAGRNCIKSEHT